MGIIMSITLTALNDNSTTMTSTARHSKWWNMNVLVFAWKFASHVQLLLVDYNHYIRDRLAQQRASKFCKLWTGPLGHWTLAHACHAGSNNNMGVKVDNL
jgi:hypothetical protein